MKKDKIGKFMKKLLKEDKLLIEKIRKLDYKEGGSFILSVAGNIYHGVPFETAVLIHGEEKAIGLMIASEGKKAKFKIILVIGSEKEIIMLCGRCLVAIKRYGIPDASILCVTKSFSKIEKYLIPKLYPTPCDEKWLFD